MSSRTGVIMFFLSSFFLILIVVADDNPSQEYLNNNNEFTKDEETLYCGKINMDTDDITHKDVDHDEVFVELKWKKA